LKRIAKKFLHNFCLNIKTTLGYHPEFLNFPSGDGFPAPLQGACPSQFSHFQSLAKPRLICQSMVVLVCLQEIPRGTWLAIENYI